MSTAQTITTADQLLRASGIGRCELIRGALTMMSPAGFRHGRIVSTINRLVAGFVRERGLGVVVGAETGFHIGHDPDTVRAPDVAFVRAARVPDREPVGFFPGPPDLAVEVLSPSDQRSEVSEKVTQWLDAGCGAVWVVAPDERTVTVYDRQQGPRVLTSHDTLLGGNLLPGLELSVVEIFS